MDETMIYYGGAVKALEDGKVGGYLVLFGDKKSADLDGDYFTAETDFDLTDQQATKSVYYHHGLDDTLKKRRIGQATVGVNDTGVWIEAQLDQRDDYERAIHRLALEGKLGWSSGSAAHLVTRKGGAITQWPIAEASLTPTPADPRNVAVPLKSVQPGSIKSLITDGETTPENPAPEAADSREPVAANGLAEVTPQSVVKKSEVGTAVTEEDMGDEMKAVLEQMVAMKTALDNLAPVEPETPAEDKSDDAMKALQTQIDELKAAAPGESEHPGHALPNVNTKAHSKRGDDNDGTVGFMQWMKTGDLGAVDASLKASNVNPLESNTDAQGAVTVPDGFYNKVIEKRGEASIARAAGALEISTDLDVVNVPAESTGATYFAITAQEGSVDEDEPIFAQVAISIYDYSKLVKISRNLLMDQKANLESFLAATVGRALAITENKYFLTGSGSGQPQGVFVGGTAGLTLDAETAIAAAEIPELFWKLSSEYMDRAVWLLRGATYGSITGLAGSDRWFAPTPYGSPLPVPGAAVGSLEGKAVYTSDEVAAVAESAKTMAVANLAAGYMIAQRESLSVQRLNELYAGTGQVGFIWWTRFGGAVVNADAIQYATQKAAA